MQNIHSHTWDFRKHLQEFTIRETDISRGYPLDLSVTIDGFLKEMEPFERVVVFGMKARLTGYWVPDEYTAEFVAKAPHKLIGFACCDPSQPNFMEELRYGIEKLHLRGVKIGPIYNGVDPRDPRCDVLYAYCQERGLPILFHTGTTYNRAAVLNYGRAWLWDEVASKYPELRMILAHVGHPFFDECLCVIRKHPHVYADVSALFHRNWQFYNIMLLAQEYRIQHKLLFGTDYPFCKSQEHIDGVRNVNKVTGTSGLPQISQQAIEDIINRDSCALLGLK
jgi:predicted TIM-barrel fold metal-dependent hydrolase